MKAPIQFSPEAYEQAKDKVIKEQAIYVQLLEDLVMTLHAKVADLQSVLERQTKEGNTPPASSNGHKDTDGVLPSPVEPLKPDAPA